MQFSVFVGFELDGIASIEYLLSRSDIDHEQLILYGRSLGGAVAFNVASLEKYVDLLFAVIVENTFTSIPEISRHLFKYLTFVPTWCYKNKVWLIFCIKGIKCYNFLFFWYAQVVHMFNFLRLYHRILRWLVFGMINCIFPYSTWLAEWKGYRIWNYLKKLQTRWTFSFQFSINQSEFHVSNLWRHGYRIFQIIFCYISSTVDSVFLLIITY